MLDLQTGQRKLRRSPAHPEKDGASLDLAPGIPWKPAAALDMATVLVTEVVLFGGGWAEGAVMGAVTVEANVGGGIMALGAVRDGVG